MTSKFQQLQWQSEFHVSWQLTTARYQNLQLVSECSAIFLKQLTYLCVCKVYLFFQMKPPIPGDPSYPQFIREKKATHRTLSERAKMAHRELNSIPGYSCNTIDVRYFFFLLQSIIMDRHRSGRGSILIVSSIFSFKINLDLPGLRQLNFLVG